MLCVWASAKQSSELSIAEQPSCELQSAPASPGLSGIMYSPHRSMLVPPYEIALMHQPSVVADRIEMVDVASSRSENVSVSPAPNA